MNLETSTGVDIDSSVLENYFKSLINSFFKILPMKEQNENSLDKYIKSLQIELLGCKNLMVVLNNDALFISLLSVLQYLIDNPQSEQKLVKREVFKCISICNKLRDRLD